MKRTPTTSPPPQKQAPSDSDLPTANESENPGVLTRKAHKRKRLADGFSDSLSTLKKDLTDVIDVKFKKLEDQYTELNQRNGEVCKAVEFFMAKYDEMKNELAVVAKERKEEQAYIKELENKLEVFEKNNKSSSVELRNVPKSENESKTDLLKIAANLATSIGLDLKKSEIDDMYRINPKSGKNSIVLLKFTTTIRKEELIKAVKKYNRGHSTKLNSQQLGMGSPTVPIYIAEHLTAKTRRLFFLARDFAKANNFAFCWCSHGRIFLRKKEGGPQMLVQDEKQLDELKGRKEDTSQVC